MGICELRELDLESQLMFAKEYLPLVYEMVDKEVEITKDENDISPIMPSFDDNDEMFFTRDGRRKDGKS
jgi:predicted lipid carrier protein YhbT